MGHTVSKPGKYDGERFWAFVEKTDTCWLWRGMLRGEGYGGLRYERKENYAHRVAWELANGRPVPVGLVVMHSCDNRICCRPEHLSVGTFAENSADMVRKKRQARAERAGSTKLTREIVSAIRVTAPMAKAAGYAERDLARIYGVGPNQINRIIRHLDWKDET